MLIWFRQILYREKMAQTITLFLYIHGGQQSCKGIAMWKVSEWKRMVKNHISYEVQDREMYPLGRIKYLYCLLSTCSIYSGLKLLGELRQLTIWRKMMQKFHKGNPLSEEALKAGKECSKQQHWYNTAFDVKKRTEQRLMQEGENVFCESQICELNQAVREESENVFL